MDLSIETLAGTSFELRVSPFETIMGVKVKIQRLEGIPVSQQHLIWKSMELKDDCSLHDYSICNGSSLKLVLAMRGGPISTRRVSVEDPALREMAEYMEANRDEILDKLIHDDNQVTLLVFREGDQLNFYRVYDRGDGTLTPLSDSVSPSSLCGIPAEEAVEDNLDDASLSERQKENETIRLKLSSLRQKMAVGKKAQKEMIPCPPTAEKPESVSRRRSVMPFSSFSRFVSSSPTSRMSSTCTHDSSPSWPIPPRNPLPPLPRKCLVSSGGTRQASQMDNDAATKDDEDATSMLCQPTYERSAGQLPVVKSRNHSSKYTRSTIAPSREKDKTHLAPVGRSALIDQDQGLIQRRRSPHRSSSRRIVELVPHSNMLTGEETPTKAEIQGSKLHDKARDLPFSSHPHQKTNLPSLTTVDAVVSKRRQRCVTCRKRLGIATTFLCRCGNNFCGIHRYPETHQCTFDHKSEGRKVLQRNNPVVAAPKLPKI